MEKLKKTVNKEISKQTNEMVENKKKAEVLRAEEELKAAVSKQVNPSQDVGNYIIQIVRDGKIDNAYLALNSTINIQVVNGKGATIILK